MLRKLKIYGELAEFIGHKEFEIQVDSLAKAVSFLVNNFPQVEKYMNPNYYQIKVGDYTISEEELCNPIGQEDIHIVPVVAGSGRIGRIFLGVALIAFSFGAFGAFGGGLTFGKGFAASWKAASLWGAKGALLLGGTLALSGVSELLYPLPKLEGYESEQDPKLSFNFSGTQNTSRAGTPVPIVYGEIMTGSVVISGAIDTQQVQA